MIKELKLKYSLFTISEKFIFINFLIFGIASIISALYFLFVGEHLNFIYSNLAIPEDLSILITKPWTFLTNFFYHSGFKHLFWNMVALYFFGRIFLVFFNTKQFVKYYMLGGLFAGFVFVASYNLFPALIEVHATGVGASASIFALLFGVTTKAPNYTFNLFGIFQIPLWVICALYTLLFISSIPSANTGGELAHLGGAFLGYFYTKQLDKGNDIGLFLERFYNWISNTFKSNKNPKMKTVHKQKSKVAGDKKEEFKELNNQKRVDSILDKISKSGYESLSKAEKDFLFKVGK